jgi:hypothetical protein
VGAILTALLPMINVTLIFPYLQLIPALRFIRTHKKIKANVSRFLEAALAPPADMPLFFIVYKFFEQREDVITELPAQYVQLYKQHFESSPSIATPATVK